MTIGTYTLFALSGTLFIFKMGLLALVVYWIAKTLSSRGARSAAGQLLGNIPTPRRAPR